MILFEGQSPYSSVPLKWHVYLFCSSLCILFSASLTLTFFQNGFCTSCKCTPQSLFIDIMLVSFIKGFAVRGILEYMSLYCKQSDFGLRQIHISAGFFTVSSLLKSTCCEAILCPPDCILIPGNKA